MNNKEGYVRTDNDGNHDNGDGIFEHCNDFEVSEDSSQRVDVNNNSLVVDYNCVKLHIDEPYSQTVLNDNNVEYSRIVSTNASLLHCETSIRILKNEDV